MSDQFYDTVAPVVAASSALCLLVVQSSVPPVTIDIFASLWGHPSVAAALNAIRNNATMWCGLEHGALLLLLLIIGTVGALWLSVWRWTDGSFFPRWCIISTRRGAQSCRRCAYPRPRVHNPNVPHLLLHAEGVGVEFKTSPPKRRDRPLHDTIKESPSTMAIVVRSETSTDPTPPMPWWVADVVVPCRPLYGISQSRRSHPAVYNGSTLLAQQLEAEAVRMEKGKYKKRKRQQPTAEEKRESKRLKTLNDEELEAQRAEEDEERRKNEAWQRQLEELEREHQHLETLHDEEMEAQPAEEDEERRKNEAWQRQLEELEREHQHLKTLRDEEMEAQRVEEDEERRANEAWQRRLEELERDHQQAKYQERQEREPQEQWQEEPPRAWGDAQQFWDGQQWRFPYPWEHPEPAFEEEPRPEEEDESESQQPGQDYLTHCTRLGIQQNDSHQEATRKFRTLARKHHPDKHGNSPHSVAIMQAINASWGVVKAHHPAF